MPSYQEQFTAFFNVFWEEIQKNVVDLHRSLELVSICRTKALDVENDDSVTASEYWFCGFIACFCHLLDNGMSVVVLNDGKEMIDHALSLLPEDKEYRLYHIIYSIFEIDRNDGMKAYLKMKDIYKECPSFRLLDKNLLPAEWAEDRFNQLFSRYLIPIVDNLMETADKETCIEACSLLSSMPPTLAKLKAYTYLSRILFEQNKFDESLRTAKLGVELLGSNHPFNHKEEISLLWTRVATCNRAKTEYDFAMSLYEKGASNGIPDCIKYLGEMYEKGESEDPDPKLAEELYEKARTLKDQYDCEAKEEQERVERERKAEEERIRQEEERKRLEDEKRKKKEALAKLKKKNRTKKIILAVTSSCLFAGCILGILFLVKHYPKDTLSNYVKQKVAILDYDFDENPYIILMDKKGVYFDNFKSKDLIIPVGEELKSDKIEVFPGTNGATIKSVDSGSWIVESSKNLKVERISEKSFLFYPQNNENNSVGTVPVCRLVMMDEKETKSYYLGNTEREGSVMKFFMTNDLFASPSCAKSVEKAFSSNEIRTIQSKGMSKFQAYVQIDAKTGKMQVNGDISFPFLERKYRSDQFATETVLRTFIEDARVFVTGRLTDNVLSKLVDLSQAEEKVCSPDKKKTFVTIKDYSDKHDILSLYMIDNSMRTSQLIDHAKGIEYLPDRIRLVKHGRFLIIFRDDSYIYYNYDGTKL